MKNAKKYAALCLALTCAFSGCGVTEGMMEVSSNKVTADTEVTEEKTVSPRDDYYRYVNGEKLANAEFKYNQTTYEGSFDPELVDDQVKDIIREVAAGSGYEKGSEEDIIKTAYDRFNAYDFDAPNVPAEIDDLLHEIDSVSSVEELLDVDVKLQRDFGVANIFGASVETDSFSPGRRIITFTSYKGVLDVEFKSLEDSFGALNPLKEMGSAALRTLGHDKEEAESTGKAFGMLVMDLYNATDMEIAESLMPYKYIETLTVDGINGIITNADIVDYFEKIGMDPAGLTRFAVVDRGQLEGINALLTEENLEALKVWRMSALLAKYRRFVAAGYSEMEKYRQVNYDPPEEQVLNEILNIYKETDVLFVEKHYSKEMDDALVSMCDDIKEGYRGLISKALWLSEGTRNGLLEKLDNIVYVTGADRKRHDPKDHLDIGGDDYYEFYKSYTVHGIKERIKSLTEPVDRKEIQMPMQMVNACYDPSFNNITITVAITYPPFFDVNDDYYSNLGGLGATIAHEMGHAFDSNCIVFDQNGVYDPSWIDSADIEKLNERNEKAIRYFEDKFTVFGVYHVDGAKTLGENYADLGGMECISSLASTKEQRENLFENYAVSWCQKIVDESLLGQLDSDEHSPNIIRVNAILSTLDDFYETYGVNEGDGMYIPPEERISRWY